METKESLINVELQNRVLDAMFVFSDLGDGVIKSTIPDKIFTGNQKMKIEGKEYGIYEIPGMEEVNASPKIIERAIDKFIASRGAPTWSQVVTDIVEEPGFPSDRLVSYPKTVYLKK